MKIVYLTSGPRGSGKSTYVELVKSTNPEVLVLDRDEIFLKEYGTVGFDPYSGMGDVAHDFFNQQIREVVGSAGENAKIIFDVWNGYEKTRQNYVQLLRDLGVEVIVCWYFITPLPQSLKWARQKPGYGDISQDGMAWDYNLYHREAVDINYPDDEFYFIDNTVYCYDAQFDIIRRINPLQLTLPGVEMI